VKQGNDWKDKYQASIKELDSKEDEWDALEEALHKAISGMSSANRCADSALDQRLEEIQKFSHKKQDQKLLETLEQLVDIIALPDDDLVISNTDADIANSFEPPSILLEMRQDVQLDQNQKVELQKVCIDLPQLITKGTDLKSIEPQDVLPSDIIIKDLAADINTIDITNAQLSNATELEVTKSGASIDVITCTLLEQLTMVHGTNAEMDQIQARIEKGLASTKWPDTLYDIASSASLALKKLNDEKSELEHFIVTVTEQLGNITDAITDDFEEQKLDQSDTLSLQELVQSGVTAIKDNVNVVQNITQLKTVVNYNIDSIRDGVETFILRANERYDTTETRNENLSNKIAQMEQETTKLQLKLTESRKKLLYDNLTGIRSRPAYDEQIIQELARWNQYGAFFSYVILHIDHFKRVNDEYGHNAGDKVLRLIAQLMQKQIRKSDALFRIGGEEFVLLLTNTSAAQAEPLITKLRKVVADSGFHFKHNQVALTISAGITESTTKDTVKTMYGRADAALCRAKDAGRNRQFMA
jgi:diguanylate cyclase